MKTEEHFSAARVTVTVADLHLGSSKDSDMAQLLILKVPYTTPCACFPNIMSTSRAMHQAHTAQQFLSLMLGKKRRRVRDSETTRSGICGWGGGQTRKGAPRVNTITLDYQSVCVHVPEMNGMG